MISISDISWRPVVVAYDLSSAETATLTSNIVGARARAPGRRAAPADVEALLVSFDTDWLFPSAELRRVRAAMHEAGVAAKHVEVATPNGRDAFLVDYPLITPQVRDFLATL